MTFLYCHILNDGLTLKVVRVPHLVRVFVVGVDVRHEVLVMVVVLVGIVMCSCKT